MSGISEVKAFKSRLQVYQEQVESLRKFLEIEANHALPQIKGVDVEGELDETIKLVDELTDSLAKLHHKISEKGSGERERKIGFLDSEVGKLLDTTTMSYEAALTEAERRWEHFYKDPTKQDRYIDSYVEDLEEENPDVSYQDAVGMAIVAWNKMVERNMPRATRKSSQTKQPLPAEEVEEEEKNPSDEVDF